MSRIRKLPAILGTLLVLVVVAGGAQAAALQASPAKPWGSGQADDTRTKLQTIIIPKFDLRKGSIQEAIELLRRKSKEYDPNGKGINILLLPFPRGGTVQISSPGGNAAPASPPAAVSANTGRTPAGKLPAEEKTKAKEDDAPAPKP